MRKLVKTIPSLSVGPLDSFCCLALNVSLDTLLQINDQINTVLERYDAFRRGDYEAARNPVPSQYAAAAQAQAASSLIDFDDPTPAAGASSPANDLEALFGGLGSAPPVNLAGSPPPVNPATRPAPPPQTQSQLGGSIVLPSTPSPGPAQIPRQPAPPGYFNTSAARPQQPVYSGASSSQLAYSNGAQQPPYSNAASIPQQPQQQPQPAVAPQGKDPFADLAGLF